MPLESQCEPVPTAEPASTAVAAIELEPLRSARLAAPTLFGTLCGLCSAVGYTAANIGLRAVSDCDPIWVSCVKAVPTLVFVAPWFVAGFARGQRVLPAPRVLVILLLTGLVGQLFGNATFQWSLGVIGIALSVPITLGSMIVGGAVLGRIVLGEPVTVRSAVSISVLVLAIFVLSLGAGEAHRAVTSETATSAASFVLGVVAACVAGVAYALLGVVIRYSVTDKASVPVTLGAVALAGVVGLGSWSLVRIGWAGITATQGSDLALMILAGICNAIAFVALVKALQVTSIVYVNALNATQATMAAIAGLLFFHEPLLASTGTGVLLTVVGFMLLDRRR